MPFQQSRQSQRLCKALRDVEHQLRQPFAALADFIAIDDLQTQAPRQR
jgi:hypothetical protein